MERSIKLITLTVNGNSSTYTSTVTANKIKAELKKFGVEFTEKETRKTYQIEIDDVNEETKGE